MLGPEIGRPAAQPTSSRRPQRASACAEAAVGRDMFNLADGGQLTVPKVPSHCHPESCLVTIQAGRLDVSRQLPGVIFRGPGS